MCWPKVHIEIFFYRNMVELNFQLCRKYVPSSNLPMPMKIDAHVNKLQPNVFNKIHAKVIAESWNGQRLTGLLPDRSQLEDFYTFPQSLGSHEASLNAKPWKCFHGLKLINFSCLIQIFKSIISDKTRWFQE